MQVWYALTQYLKMVWRSNSCIICKNTQKGQILPIALTTALRKKGHIFILTFVVFKVKFGDAACMMSKGTTLVCMWFPQAIKHFLSMIYIYV